MHDTLWPQDQWGRVLNGALERSQLPIEALDLSESAVDLAYERFESSLHSVYLSGPLARDLSELVEVVIVLRQMRPAMGLDLFCAAAALRLQKLHPICESVRFDVYAWEDVFPSDGRFSRARFKIAVNSICIAGRDLKRLIAPQRLSQAAANARIVGLRDRLITKQRRLSAIATESRVITTSRDFARLALQACFAVVMVDEQIYTECFETMAHYAALSFPDRIKSLSTLADMAEFGTNNRLDALLMADDVMSWLPDIAESWLDRHNPERELALRLV